MEAVPLRQLPGLERAAPATDDEWDWVYEDPDLAPFLSTRARRKETPLTAWLPDVS